MYRRTMLDGIPYTEEDAEFDSQLVLREIEDLNPSTWMGNAITRKLGTEQDNQVVKTIQAHLRNIRFSKFAREALHAEYHNSNSIGDHTEGVLSEPIQQEKPLNEQIESYRQRLGECSRIPAVCIPNVGQMISDAGSVRVDASMKQLKKDIERDRLLVNGIRIVGAELGLDTVLQKMCDICDIIHSECGMPMLGNEVKEFAVLSLLSKASRSHSGGIAFQAVQSLIDPAVAMLVPQSAVTPPLKINIHLGAFPTTRSTRSSEQGKDHSTSCTTTTTGSLSCTEGSCTSISEMPSSPTGDVPSSSSLHSGQHSGHPVSSTHPLDTTVNPVGKCKWGLVCKVTCESIFKIQLFDAPEEVGYDDCSTADIDHGDDEAPCMFRPVANCPETEKKISGISESLGASGESTAAGGSVKDTSIQQESEKFSGVSLGHRNTFVSAVYEDFVLFEVKLSPEGELANLENLVDNWKETASVTITEIVPMRTLM